MSTEILLKGVNKHYGSKQALKNVDLVIPRGMYGLLGRNGAGKTTLMKTIATLLPADGGDIFVCGVPVKNAAKVREMIGYLPQDFSMYGNMTVYEAMDYLGVLSGLGREQRRQRIPQLLERVNLQNNHRTKVKTMSGGMRRRLGIAQAILHEPKVLIVDEPTAGLDPEERVRFRNLLCELAEERIVILSTHIVADVEATCEHIAVMDAGEILYTGTVSELLRLAEGKVFTADVSHMELDRVKSEYLVTGMLNRGSLTSVRFLLKKPGQKLLENAGDCEVNVEDAYMYLMYRERGDVSCF